MSIFGFGSNTRELTYEEMDKCPECGSIRIEFISREKYINASDDNPCNYICNCCGHKFILWR